MLDENPQALIYHLPEIVRAYAETIGTAILARPMVGIAKDEDGRQVLPWFIITYQGKFAPRRVLEPIGQVFFGYHDPLAAASDIPHIRWDAFWDEVRRSLSARIDQALFHFVHAEYAQGGMLSNVRK